MRCSYSIPGVFPYLLSTGLFVFAWDCTQTDRLTDRQTLCFIIIRYIEGMHAKKKDIKNWVMILLGKSILLDGKKKAIKKSHA